MNVTSFNAPYKNGLVVSAGGNQQSINFSTHQDGSDAIKCITEGGLFSANIIITYVENLSSGPKILTVNGTISGGVAP